MNNSTQSKNGTVRIVCSVYRMRTKRIVCKQKPMCSPNTPNQRSKKRVPVRTRKVSRHHLKSRSNCISEINRFSRRWDMNFMASWAKKTTAITKKEIERRGSNDDLIPCRMKINIIWYHLFYNNFMINEYIFMMLAYVIIQTMVFISFFSEWRGSVEVEVEVEEVVSIAHVQLHPVQRGPQVCLHTLHHYFKVSSCLRNFNFISCIIECLLEQPREDSQ